MKRLSTFFAATALTALFSAQSTAGGPQDYGYGHQPQRPTGGPVYNGGDNYAGARAGAAANSSASINSNIRGGNATGIGVGGEGGVGMGGNGGNATSNPTQIIGGSTTSLNAGGANQKVEGSTFSGGNNATNISTNNSYRGAASPPSAVANSFHRCGYAVSIGAAVVEAGASVGFAWPSDKCNTVLNNVDLYINAMQTDDKVTAAAALRRIAVADEPFADSLQRAVDSYVAGCKDAINISPAFAATTVNRCAEFNMMVVSTPVVAVAVPPPAKVTPRRPRPPAKVVTPPPAPVVPVGNRAHCPLDCVPTNK